MKVVITGGSGFVGTHLSRHLLNAGHEVTALGSRPSYGLIEHARLTYVAADTSRPGPWQQAIADADILFNLAGRNIFQRWTNRYKQQIYDSRVKTTRNLVAALHSDSKQVLVSTSAVGYYGSCGDVELTEEASPGDDFLAELAVDWEARAMAAESRGARVAVARFGVVLGTEGGALAKMVPAFRSFMGGPLGDGKQWFPWIHIRDMVAALVFLATEPGLTGPFNLTAPNPVRNGEMAEALGKALGRPSVMAAPAFMLKMAMGEMAAVLLASQRALPARLLEAGFQFAFPRIGPALEDLMA